MAAIYNPGFTAVKKSGNANSFIDANFSKQLKMLIFKDLTSKSAKGYRGLLYPIFSFVIEIAVFLYNAAQILKGWYYC